MEKIKLTLITGLLLLLFGNHSNAQELYLDWVKQMGGSGSIGSGHSLIVDDQGNIYTAGNFRGQVDFDPGLDSLFLDAGEGTDIFIQKMDASGHLIWVRQLAETSGNGWASCYSIHVDELGNLYATGAFARNVDFDPGPGTFYLHSINNEDPKDIFVLKLDSLGDFVWAKKMGGTLSDAGSSIKTDASGNVYTVGHFYKTVDFDPGPEVYNLYAYPEGHPDMFIQKLNADGEFLWAREIGNEGVESGSSIVLDNVGNIFITGGFSQTADFDPGLDTFNLTAFGIADVFVQKLDSSGNLVWVRQMGGIGWGHGQSLKLDESGNIYLKGGFSQTVDFDPGPDTLNLTAVGDVDIFVQKLDASGNLVWVRQMGGQETDAAKSLSLDAVGNIYSVGFFEGTAAFDLITGTTYLDSYGDWDIYIQKLDNSGNIIWVKQFGGTGNDRCHSIEIDQLGIIYITGQFEAIVDFDPGLDSFNLTSNGWEDIFVLKMSQCPLSASINSDADFEICEGESISLTANGGSSYLWNTGDSTAMIMVSPVSSIGYSVTITDSLGCSINEAVQITVEPAPTALFDFTVSSDTVDFNNLSSSNAISFEWDFGDNSGSTEINPSHTYAQSGIYTVQLITFNECGSDTITQEIEVIFTSTKIIGDKSLIDIFPNPATDLLTIKSDIKIETIQIANVLGQRVLEISDTVNIREVGLSSLSPGIYVITLIGEGQMWAVEFIKQ